MAKPVTGPSLYNERDRSCVGSLRRLRGEVRLRGKSLRGDRSLREIAAELKELGFVNERGTMFTASSVQAILAGG